MVRFTLVSPREVFGRESSQILGPPVAGGGPFASDTFTDSDGVLLHNHTASDDGTWAIHPSSANNFVFIGNCIRNTGSTGVIYTHSGAPASADYRVAATVRVLTDNNLSGAGVIARASMTVDENYHARINTNSNQLQLYKFSGGATLLGSFGFTPSAGTDYLVEVETVGTTIKAYLDSVQRISVSDSTISAVGKAGVRGFGEATDSTGCHIADFEATDA